MSSKMLKRFSTSSKEPQTNHSSSTLPPHHQIGMNNLTAGKSRIHIYCLLLVTILVIIRFFIVSPFDSNTNNNLADSQQQKQRVGGGNAQIPKIKMSGNDATEKNNAKTEQQLPAWVTEKEVDARSSSSKLSSLNQQPPTYPKETNNNKDAVAVIHGLIKRVFSKFEPSQTNLIVENFLKVFTINIHEEAHQGESNDNDWCKLSPASNIAPDKKSSGDCFKLEFLSTKNENSNNKNLVNRYIHLHLTASSRIAASRGFYHVLKHYMDSSVMWGVEQTGINLNVEIFTKLLSKNEANILNFWKDVLLNQLVRDARDSFAQPVSNVFGLPLVADSSTGKDNKKSANNNNNNKAKINLSQNRRRYFLIEALKSKYSSKDNNAAADLEKTISDVLQELKYQTSLQQQSTSTTVKTATKNKSAKTIVNENEQNNEDNNPADASTTSVAILHSSHTPLRYNYNLCTFAYSMSWWGWPEWEREIDWMALHGINMPLALVGQEAVWLKLWTEVLFPNGLVSRKDVLENHFTGSAFWPWHWMGNLRKWAGPVTVGYVEKRMKLQKQILKRMREYKMFFVLPAFAGHVPEQVGKILSEWFNEELPKEEGRGGRIEIQSPDEWINSYVQESVVDRLLGRNKGESGKQHKKRKQTSDHIRRSALWMGFNSKSSGVVTLSPSHPLFAKISYHFTKTLTDMYGTAHFYSADQFNEMPPPTLHPKFLAQSGKSVVDGIQRVNPHGRWVVQGWLFLHHHRIWSRDAVKTYLDGAGAGNVVVLDLASDIRELIPIHNHFYGHDHIWCLLHNFGGRRGIFGDMPAIADKMIRASYLERLAKNGNNNNNNNEENSVNKNLVGFGLTMEATHHNPAMYELTTDLMFTDTFVAATTVATKPEADSLGDISSKIVAGLRPATLVNSLLISFTDPSFQNGQEEDAGNNILNPSSLLSPSDTITQFLLRSWWKSYIVYRYNTFPSAYQQHRSASAGLFTPFYYMNLVPDDKADVSVLAGAQLRSVKINNNNNGGDDGEDQEHKLIKQVDDLYRKSAESQSAKLIQFEAVKVAALNLTNSVPFFAALSERTGPYNHPHDCCPSFSLIPFLPVVYSTVSSYALGRGNTDLDTAYHPESLFVVSSWLLTKLKTSTNPTDVERLFDKKISGVSSNNKKSVENNTKNRNSPLRHLDTLIYDSVDFTRQVLDTTFFEMHDSYQKLLALCSVSARVAKSNNNNNKKNNNENNNKNRPIWCPLRDDIATLGKSLLDFIEDMDDLSCASPNFDLFEAWLKPAMKNWGEDEKSNDDENKYKNVLFNAKNLITAWGDSNGQGYPNYAARSWCGLYKRLYLKRWKVLLDSIQKEVDEGIFTDIIGTNHLARKAVASMDWDFAVENKEDIQKFLKSEKNDLESSSSAPTTTKSPAQTILDVAGTWLAYHQYGNSAKVQTVQQDRISPLFPWHSDFSDSASDYFDNAFDLILPGQMTRDVKAEHQRDKNSINFNMIQHEEQKIRLNKCTTKMYALALRDAKLNSASADFGDLGKGYSDQSKNSNNQGTTEKNEKSPDSLLMDQKIYMLRERGSWTAHPAATASACRNMRHCVGFDSYGAIYIASSPQVMKYKLCDPMYDTPELHDDESVPAIAADRYFWIRRQ